MHTLPSLKHCPLKLKALPGIDRHFLERSRLENGEGGPIALFRPIVICLQNTSHL